MSGTRSSSWHIRLKRSSFSLCGDGDGTAGPSAVAKGGFGFCRETSGSCSRVWQCVPTPLPHRSGQGRAQGSPDFQSWLCSGGCDPQPSFALLSLSVI